MSGNKEILDSLQIEKAFRDRCLFLWKDYLGNFKSNTFRYIKRLLNSIIKNNLENKNDPESVPSFKVIYVESKKYIQDTNPH